MRILEQILQEIEDEMRCYREISSDGRIAYGIASGEDYKRKGIAEGLQKAIRIIHTHIEDDGWIPVEMKNDEWTPESILPKEGQKVLTTIEYGSKKSEIKRAHFEKGSFWNNGYIAYDYIIKAWQPLPEPYKPKEEKR